MDNSLSWVSLLQVPTSVNHQIYFENRDMQKQYFDKHVIKTFDKCSFTDRHSTIRIKDYDESVNYNYLMFQNNLGQIKYAFINSHRFIAQSTIEVDFSIDVIQTYMFDITFRPCFIERCMPDSDEIGEFTIAEDFALGDVITCKRTGTTALKPEFKPSFILARVSQSSGYSMFGDVFSGLTFIYYDHNHAHDLKLKINEMMSQGKGDEIAYIFCFPDYFKSQAFPNGSEIGIQDLISFVEHYKIDNSVLFEGYKPYNNKLYTYPFSFITISNNSGSNIVIKRELLADKYQLNYKLECLISPNVSVHLTPLDYSGRSVSYDDSISMNDYPLCSWVNDTYANWSAQHSHSIEAQSQNALLSYKTSNKISDNNYNTADKLNNMSLGKSLFNTAVGGITSLAGGNIAGGLTTLATGGINAGIDYTMGNISNNNARKNARISSMSSYQASVNSLMASVEDMKISPNSCRGDTLSNGLEIARGNADFHLDMKSIRYEYAKIIDMYFQQFGYKVNMIDNPKKYLHTRKKWNYIKTLNCNVFARNVPFDDIEVINAIFDNGVTFWHDDMQMLNYTQQNEIRRD